MQDFKIECNPPLIASDSLLSIKEEIIDSEHLTAEQLLPNHTEQTEINYTNNNNNKLEQNESEPIEKLASKNSNNKVSQVKTVDPTTPLPLPSSNSTSKDIQEANKSQTIKSPNFKATESGRQIQTQQPTTDKVLNNQTNYLNENHTSHIVTTESEEG